MPSCGKGLQGDQVAQCPRSSEPLTGYTLLCHAGGVAAFGNLVSGPHFGPLDLELLVDEADFDDYRGGILNSTCRSLVNLPTGSALGPAVSLIKEEVVACSRMTS